MKGLRLLFVVCLGFLTICEIRADSDTDTARAATRRGVSSVVQSRQNISDANESIRANNAPQKTSVNATTARSGTSVARTAVARTDTTNNTARSATNVVQRTATTPTVVSRNAATSTRIAPRNATPATNSARVAQTPMRRVTVTRSALQQATKSGRTAKSGARISRAATTTDGANVIGANYTQCRDIYYDCMDEFCANKDAQLKRCACSSRIHEFDNTKKQLAAFEEKMLDFNQRLLTVNMDKEDAAALYTATEGELAFNQKDTSQSKKILDEIAKKLNTSFDSSNFDTNLNPISLSLNIDSAFDTVDSLQGASTTAKSGTSLYNAALPVCREMALEVCSEEEFAIAQSGYQMKIEQDCNTVAKTYQTQTDTAREKIREGSALLDMSRLDIYQKRNSDDILTCKKKMLDMMYDPTVCGENLDKCLDTTGRYIDPSTGEAFLTLNLADLANLITRPTGDEKWTTAGSNDVFVSYLNTKKKFLEPAMENCQDIADYVWDDFIEDALAQIKLAQESKLENVRQSCTTLTAQCLTDTMQSLSDFDARALSIFGVSADKTVNQMCSDIRNACTALMGTTGGDKDWAQGITDITTDKTYETMIQTCREVGRACIIQACTSISGNFGLCENIDTSINRKSIINRTACWQEVENCVASAGVDSINKIMDKLESDNIIDSDGRFYEYLYGAGFETTNGSTAPANSDTAGISLESDSLMALADTGDTASPCYARPEPGANETPLNCIYDLCQDRCSSSKSFDCRKCRLTESIWGNCESAPTEFLQKKTYHNRIRHTDKTTLLSWFADNTGTTASSQSCRDTTCAAGFRPTSSDDNKVECIPDEYFATDGENCDSQHKVYISDGVTNCCKNGTVVNNVCIQNNPDNNEIKTLSPSYQPDGKKIKIGMGANTAPNTEYELKAPTAGNISKWTIACRGTWSDETGTAVTNFPSGKQKKCTGTIILKLDDNKFMFSPLDKNTPKVYYNNSTNTKDGPTITTCQYYCESTTCDWRGDGCLSTTPDQYKIEWPESE